MFDLDFKSLYFFANSILQKHLVKFHFYNFGCYLAHAYIRAVPPIFNNL